MNQEDLIDRVWAAWLAALIDGEGSIMFIRHRSKQARIKGTCGYRPRIGIYNTHLGLINTLIDKFGGNVYIRYKDGLGKRRKPVYEWRAKTVEVEMLLNWCLPFLIIKNKKAEAVLRGIKMIKARAPKVGVQSTTLYKPELEKIVEEVQNASR